MTPQARSRHLVDVTDAEAMTAAPDGSATSSEPAVEESPAAIPSKKSRSGGTFVRRNARLLAAVAFLVAGIVLVILGWYGTAYTNILTEQIPYLISGGLLGMALIIVAGFLASSAATERENRELRQELIRAIGASGTARLDPTGPSAIAPSNDGKVLVVPGGRSFHVPGCPIVEGKTVSTLALRKAVDSGYATCKLCGTD